MYELLPVTGRDMLAAGGESTAGGADLAGTRWTVISERFRGLRGLLGGLDEVIEEKMPLGEINEIAASLGEGVKEFVDSFRSALERGWRVECGYGP